MSSAKAKELYDEWMKTQKVPTPPPKPAQSALPGLGDVLAKLLVELTISNQQQIQITDQLAKGRENHQAHMVSMMEDLKRVSEQVTRASEVAARASQVAALALKEVRKNTQEISDIRRQVDFHTQQIRLQSQQIGHTAAPLAGG